MTESDIMAVVHGFENCTTDKTEFKHREHLIVAVVYLQDGDAVQRLKAGLFKFLDHHGVPRKKYSESVTRYWMDQVATKLASLPSDANLVEKCTHVLSALGVSAVKK